ncbi:MAG: Do/DeqQ family serine protease [Flammeovirgaceae bacterium]|jgi:serine protease Do
MKNTLKTIYLSLIFGFIGAYLFSLTQNPTTQSNQKETGEISLTKFPKETKEIRSDKPDFVEASAVSTESVVYIKTLSAQSYNRRQTFFDLFFEEKNNGNRITEKQVYGSGSGVVISKDGYIVTNNHVIDGADEIQVVLNKKTYVADLVGTDPSTDLALLKIQSKELTPIVVTSSKNLQVGEWVLAVGNPFNLNSTVTAGIVSAKGRKINILQDIFPIESFIQTDAAINPGNSGGALVNSSGELVGINTAILSKTGSYAGYGFAVPSDIVMKVVGDLKSYGEVQKAFMGVKVADITEEFAEQLKTKTLDGVVLIAVEEGGAGEKAGLQSGDVIVKIDNQPIGSDIAFDEQLSYYLPGKKLTIHYLRDGKANSTQVILTNLNGGTEILKREIFNATSLGADFEIVPKIERQKLNISNGIRIKHIYKQGLIRRMGIPEDFVIVGINNFKIEKPSELIEILEKIRGRVVVQGVDKNGKGEYYSYYF